MTLQGGLTERKIFSRPLQQAGLLPDVAGLEVYQMNHVWLLKLRSPEAKEKLLRAKTIEVKGKCCLVIDPNRREIRVKVHWVAFDAPLEAIRRAFEPYGDAKEVVRDVWKINGLLDAESTTLTVVMTLRQDLSEDSLPHQLRLFGGMVLVVVPGRAPICLRCRRKGHVRRDCKTPWCTECRGFGHDDKDCAKTYAGAAAKNNGNDVNDMVMDEAEAEEAASSATTAGRGDPCLSGASGGVATRATPPQEVEKTQGQVESPSLQDPKRAAEVPAVPPVFSIGDEDDDMILDTATSKRRHEESTKASDGEPTWRRIEKKRSALRSMKSGPKSQPRSSSLPREDRFAQ